MDGLKKERREQAPALETQFATKLNLLRNYEKSNEIFDSVDLIRNVAFLIQ
jgi:hypothetical protein